MVSRRAIPHIHLFFPRSVFSLSSGGLAVFSLAIACLLVGQALQIGSNFWLSIWSDENLKVRKRREEGREGGRGGGLRALGIRFLNLK